MSRSINAIVIHCSASPNGRVVTAQEIDAWHAARGFQRSAWRVSNGLPHIGYHYVVTLDGAVVRGREEDEIGAHVQGSNARSIGVCMIGTDCFSAAQWRALDLLVGDLRARYQAAEVLGHRDFSPDQDGDGVVEPWEWLKTCPGFEVRDWIAGKPMDAHQLET